MPAQYVSMGCAKIETAEWRALIANNRWIKGVWTLKRVCAVWFPSSSSSFDQSMSRRRVTYDLPIWILLSVVAIPTLFSFWRARKRKKPGLCQVCLYDLTGNVSGICPECGTPIPDVIKNEIR
jgi:hypothetical protein